MPTSRTLIHIPALARVSTSQMCHQEKPNLNMSETLLIEDDEKPPKAAPVGGDDSVDNSNKLLVEIWKQSVETQKHFNDMCVKSRQLGLTFVAASLGAALYLFIRSNPSGE